MIHNFKASLEKGKRGEALLLELWPELIQIDGRKGDFTLNGVKVELKTDSYTHAKSSNFFMEYKSDVAKDKPGGPWQSLSHGASIFVYFYSADMIAYIFDTAKLVKALEGLINKLKPVSIHNVAWVTTGYKIPRETLKDIFTIKDFNDK